MDRVCGSKARDKHRPCLLFPCRLEHVNHASRHHLVIICSGTVSRVAAPFRLICCVITSRQLVLVLWSYNSCHRMGRPLLEARPHTLFLVHSCLSAQNNLLINISSSVVPLVWSTSFVRPQVGPLRPFGHPSVPPTADVGWHSSPLISSPDLSRPHATGLRTCVVTRLF